MNETTTPPAEDARHRLGRWVRASARSAVFLRCDLRGVRIGPWALLLAVLWVLAVGAALQRLNVDGPARFEWVSLTQGWLSTVVVLWVCWFVARSSASGVRTSSLFGVLVLQQMVLSLLFWAMYLAIARAWLPPLSPPLPLPIRDSLTSALPWLAMAWLAMAALVVWWRHSEGWPVRISIVFATASMLAIFVFTPQAEFWYAEPDGKLAATVRERLHLTQELMELQSAAAIAALDRLQPQRAGVVDVYAITFAPYASEGVFRRESRLVDDLMQSRFDAQGRTVQLINHTHTAAELPWATALNLRRAIQRAASAMDREEDILFIHLTSHGAQNGELAASFWPVEVEPITPQQLRAWLDEAGVQYRVLSISACYSGTWLPALTEPGTLVMTAADALHTSYGCGQKSELTFFGRAMYAEQLRSTHSFEVAHAAAREVIRQREIEAGKTDGYSNPQLAMGIKIRPRLEALAARLDQAEAVQPR